MDEEATLTDLLTKLVTLVKDSQAANQEMLRNHSQAISANRDALAGIAELVNAQTKAFNILREVTLKLWEDRYGPDLPLPNDLTVN